MREDRRVCDVVESGQRTVALMRDTGGIDDHLVPEDRRMRWQGRKLLQRVFIGKLVVPSELDPALERFQLPFHFAPPESFIRRISINDGDGLRFRRYLQEVFEQDQETMGNRHDSVIVGHA